MNRNIPETFDKDKEYYTKTPDNELFFKYYFDKGSVWICENILLEDTYPYRVTNIVDCTDEIFISKEEYEDLLLIEELKK